MKKQLLALGAVLALVGTAHADWQVSSRSGTVSLGYTDDGGVAALMQCVATSSRISTVDYEGYLSYRSGPIQWVSGRRDSDTVGHWVNVLLSGDRSGSETVQLVSEVGEGPATLLDVDPAGFEAGWTEFRDRCFRLDNPPASDTEPEHR